jgi:hypothetical protein
VQKLTSLLDESLVVRLVAATHAKISGEVTMCARDCIFIEEMKR